MVLESILNPKNILKKPLHMFFLAVIYTTISIFFEWKIFPAAASILSLAFITILFIPIFFKVFSKEEKKDRLYSSPIHPNLFFRHKDAIVLYTLFFLGIIVASSFVYVFFPDIHAFDLQNNTLRSFVTGHVTGGGDGLCGSDNFSKYVCNNSQTMLLSFVLSLIFGAGAIFVLAWNASIIAVYLGGVMKSMIAAGTHPIQAYLFGIPMGLGAIALHGIPEILAYFFAGIAGGILSIGIIREKTLSKKFKNIFKDSIIFLVIAEVLIILAAYLEAAF